MLLVVAVAAVFAAGLLLVADAVWPSPRPLGAAIARLHAPGRPHVEALRSDGRSRRTRCGRWVLGRGRQRWLTDERSAADLAILQRPVELYAGTRVLAAVGGALAGPVVWVLAAAVGAPLSPLVPLWFLAVGLVIGWLAPRAALHAAAASARRDFRHALGAYLDVLVLLLAAQEGPESAMELAADAGRGAAFDELRRATWQARLSGEPVWEALDDLGRRIAVPELGEVAAAGALAGESGAAVRKSVTAKARALRTAGLAAAEAAARRQSQAMFGPLVLMGLGFITFMIYPLVTNLSVGGTG